MTGKRIDDYSAMPSSTVYGLPVARQVKLIPKSVGGILAVLFNSICYDLNISPGALMHLTRVYCDRLRQRDEIRRAQQPTAFQTLRQKVSQYNPGIPMREMMAPTMTIKVFYKALQILGVEKVEFSVIITRRGKTTSHSCMTDISMGFEEESEDDQPTQTQPSAAQDSVSPPTSPDLSGDAGKS